MKLCFKVDLLSRFMRITWQVLHKHSASTFPILSIKFKSVGNSQKLGLLASGLGPAGEMRYPSYQLQDNKWQYCGIGEYPVSRQSYLFLYFQDFSAMTNTCWQASNKQQQQLDNLIGEMEDQTTQEPTIPTLPKRDFSPTEHSTIMHPITACFSWTGILNSFCSMAPIFYHLLTPYSTHLGHQSQVLSSYISWNSHITLAKVSGIHWWYATRLWMHSKNFFQVQFWQPCSRIDCWLLQHWQQ